MTKAGDLLAVVKGAGEDFEWYPTTRRMLEVVARDLRSEMGDRGKACFSILDIGAGDGNALKVLGELTGNTGQKYAIEKSRTLTDSLPEDVFVIGTDFHQQTLIDKQVDVVFCNPPYSEFAAWMRKIVSEANCQIIYLVVPQRWKENAHVRAMMDRRCSIGDEDESEARVSGACKVLDSMSFEDSEFRRARAQVDIVKIKLKANRWRSDAPASDPFDIWFESTFKISADKATDAEYETEQAAAKELHDLVRGQNLIERLEELYQAKLAEVLGNYRALEKLDRALFAEIGVDLPKVREGLKCKIKGLKNLYWQELFNNLDTITSRLTSKSRAAMLDKLTSHTSIDFTADNAYAVVIWAIKNANAYFDRQLVDLYRDLTNKETIRNYKSNTRIVLDDWRYIKEGQHTHYILDYRLVLHRYRCFEVDVFERPRNRLTKEAQELLGDLCTIAANLGFRVATSGRDLEWHPGEKNEFFLADGTLFMDVRAHKNGNLHIRLNQDFMRRFNVEAGRLNGWLRTPAEAAAETGIENAADLYGTNFKLTSIPLLPAPANSGAAKDAA